MARGVVAGLAGTVVMTAFQKLVEMPLTRRQDSYAPADFAAKVTPVKARTPGGRRRLNNVVHLSLGTLWGAAYGVVAVRGARGQRAANSVFAVVYAGDVLLNTALGLYEPTKWSKKDWLIDVVDKYVQAQATGAIFDRTLDPAGERGATAALVCGLKARHSYGQAPAMLNSKSMLASRDREARLRGCGPGGGCGGPAQGTVILQPLPLL